MRWLVLFLFVVQAWAGDKLLVFLGEKNCPWSEKLEKEVLHNPQFIRGLRNEVAIVPMQGHEKYFVEEVPTFIVISSTGDEVGRVGYMALSASEYADYFREMLRSYYKMATLDVMSPEELRNYYLEATKYHLAQQKEILDKGLEKDPGTFFLVERYAQLLKKGSKKAKAIRREIENRDFDNKDESFFRLAVIDFQNRADENLPIEKTVKPLKRYVKDFGADWRIHMIMAEFLLGKDKLADALTEAKAAYQSAPQEKKEKLAETISHIEGNL